jgi:hypothetical protein
MSQHYKTIVNIIVHICAPNSLAPKNVDQMINVLSCYVLASELSDDFVFEFQTIFKTVF